MPLQIGAPDVAFPRLNALSYWLFLFGGLVASSSFLTPGGAADFGWFAYVPLSNATYSPGAGGDLWITGLAVGGLGTILGAVNFVTTIVCLRAPGMVMFRMPIFTWNIFITSFIILMVFPPLTAALLGLYVDRQFGGHVFDPANGGVILFQHLFWFFGHPEVYVIALPFFGIVTEVIPVFSRKPIFGYKGMVFATVGIGGLSGAVWAHHMYATGAIVLSFFALTTLLIAVPTGIKFVNWIGTMWFGRLTFETPMLSRRHLRGLVGGAVASLTVLVGGCILAGTGVGTVLVLLGGLGLIATIVVALWMRRPAKRPPTSAWKSSSAPVSSRRPVAGTPAAAYPTARPITSDRDLSRRA